MDQDESGSPTIREPLPLAVGVRFRPGGRIYDFDPGPLILRRDDRVLVETERGSEVGTVVVAARLLAKPRTLQRVIKKADARDLAREDQTLQREHGSFRNALEHVRASGLSMKLVKAEQPPESGKTVLYFFAEDRLDFRDLVRTLSQVLGTRVEMRQIGARDEAKAAGGLGVCGRELCCSSWLQEFEAVTVKMVKEQGLSLNQSKLAGQCGRLKCCMRYEYETYLDLRRALPRSGAHVECVKGDGVVVRQHILKQTVVVRRDEDGVEVEATLEDLVTRRAGA
jgi:cell fate regulator YaaT (PSP1 superfamily)